MAGITLPRPSAGTSPYSRWNLLEAVEWALQMIVDDRAQAKLYAAARAFIHGAIDFSRAVAPEDHLFAQGVMPTGHLSLRPFEQDVPLVSYHVKLLLKSRIFS